MKNAKKLIIIFSLLFLYSGRNCDWEKTYNGTGYDKFDATYYVRNYNPYYDCWSDSCLAVTVYVVSATATASNGCPYCADETV
ncbi:hypothetical protein DRQ33_06335 [bacterium]|nr:MAG: hypothetical protein DRQ33_06335 [bacterium]